MLIPNPTTGKLNVTFDANGQEKYILKVVDLIGNVLIREESTTNEGINLKELNLGGVSRGMYLLEH